MAGILHATSLATMTEHPNCLQCIHYHITHDPARPYGCRALGFKSRITPARLVQETSGLPCQLFTARPRRYDEPGLFRVA